MGQSYEGLALPEPAVQSFSRAGPPLQVASSLDRSFGTGRSAEWMGRGQDELNRLGRWWNGGGAYQGQKQVVLAAVAPSISSPWSQPAFLGLLRLAPAKSLAKVQADPFRQWRLSPRQEDKYSLTQRRPLGLPHCHRIQHTLWWHG